MTWPFIWTNLNPLYPRMLCAPVVLEKKIFKYLQYNFTYSLLSPSEKGVALHLCKLESPPSKDALWQVRLKLAQWFWRRSWKCEKFTDRQTDGQADDRQQAIRKAHLSFKLRWAIKTYDLSPHPLGQLQAYLSWYKESLDEGKCKESGRNLKIMVFFPLRKILSS